MGAEQPMMRARQRGGPCPVPGHGSRCEPATERSTRGRVDDHRDTTRAVQRDLEPQECPHCGWTDHHPRSVLGRTCVWCSKDWS